MPRSRSTPLLWALPLLLARAAPSRAEGGKVRYCVAETENVRAVKATVWRFLLPGDSARVVRDEAGRLSCVELSASPEKERLITGVVRQRHPDARVIASAPGAAATQSAARPNIAGACHLALRLGGKTLKWLYAEDRRWKPESALGCPLWVRCWSSGDMLRVDVSFSGPDRDVLTRLVKTPASWTVPTPAACAKFPGRLGVHAS
jgi:hypothetical protein